MYRYSCMKRTSCLSNNCLNYKEALLYILQYLYNLYFCKKRERIFTRIYFVSDEFADLIHGNKYETDCFALI